MNHNSVAKAVKDFFQYRRDTNCKPLYCVVSSENYTHNGLPDRAGKWVNEGMTKISFPYDTEFDIETKVGE